jgi:hypothetical protein
MLRGYLCIQMLVSFYLSMCALVTRRSSELTRPARTVSECGARSIPQRFKFGLVADGAFH